MLLHSLPQLLVLLHAHLLARVELHYAAEIHLLGEERLDVGVESLPVRVLEVVSETTINTRSVKFLERKGNTYFWLLSSAYRSTMVKARGSLVSWLTNLFR